MSPIEVFLDTAAVIALASKNDKYHPAAEKVAQQLSADRTVFVTTTMVLVESVNLLKRWEPHHIALEAVESILAERRAGSLILLSVDEELLLRSWALLKSRPDKHWSLTDCISFVVMQDRGITTAFTADRHFAQAGFRALLRG